MGGKERWQLWLVPLLINLRGNSVLVLAYRIGTFMNDNQGSETIGFKQSVGSS
jgi:hypothetical protein